MDAESEPIAVANQNQVEKQNKGAAHHAEFFRECGKDKVGMFFGEEIQVALGAGKKTFAPDAAGAEGNFGLNNMVAGSLRVAFRVQERQNSILLVVVQKMPKHGGCCSDGGDDGGEFPPLDTGEIKQGGGTEQDHQRCAQIRLNHNKCDGDGNSNGRNDYAAQGADFFVRRIAEVAGELQNDGQFHQFGRLKLEETEVYPALGAHAGMSGDINDKKQKEREQIKRSGDFIVEFGTNQCGDNHNAQSHAEADSLIECPRCHFASGGGIKGNAAYGSQKGNDEDENKIQVKKAFFER